jgi:hypothetical protein
MVCPSQSRPRARSLMILAPLYPCSCFPFPRIRISPSIYRHSDLAPARAYYSVRISNGGNYRPPQNQKVRHELCCHASQDRRSQVVSRADEVSHLQPWARLLELRRYGWLPYPASQFCRDVLSRFGADFLVSSRILRQAQKSPSRSCSSCWVSPDSGSWSTSILGTRATPT